jgi:hypothetical protein
MTTKPSKRWILFIVAPVVLVGGLVGGALANRAREEGASRAAAQEFLGRLAPGKPVKDAYALTQLGKSKTSPDDLRQFDEVVLRTGLVGVKDATCAEIQRETNFLNSFTMGLHSVRCRWAGGGGLITVTDGEIVALQVDGKLYESLSG